MRACVMLTPTFRMRLPVGWLGSVWFGLKLNRLFFDFYNSIAPHMALYYNAYRSAGHPVCACACVCVQIAHQYPLRPMRPRPTANHPPTCTSIHRTVRKQTTTKTHIHPYLLLPLAHLQTHERTFRFFCVCVPCLFRIIVPEFWQPAAVAKSPGLFTYSMLATFYCNIAASCV